MPPPPPPRPRSGFRRRDFLTRLAAAPFGIGTAAAAAVTPAGALPDQPPAAVATGNYDLGPPSNALVTGVDPQELVLFAFDDHWIPLRHHLALELSQPTPHPNNPVMRRGGPGELDHFFASLYGTVFLLDGKFRMWYGAVDSWEEFQPGRTNMRLAYAESSDGVEWVKPKLGLQTYHGSKDNNLLALGRECYNCLVIYDPEDLDPRQRFKMSFVGYHHPGMPIRPLLCTAFSPDGFRWTESADNPVIRNTWAEASGLYRWNGIYYCNGQSGWPLRNPKRTMISFASGNFRHWEQAAIVSFHRWVQDNAIPGPERPVAPGSAGPNPDNIGPQVHLGASIWHRRSVLLGLYGKWENEEQGRSPGTRIDLGLIISNDGLLFREPVPGFRFIPWGSETSGWKTLRLLQAQAFVNHGDKTFIWYSAASDDTGQAIAMENQAEVGLATLPRDRFGCLRPYGPEATWTSQALPPMPGGAEVAFNVDGLNPDSGRLRVELLAHDFSPLEPFSGPKAARLSESGLRAVAKWDGANTLAALPHPWRIRVTWEGGTAETARFYCAYVRDAKRASERASKK